MPISNQKEEIDIRILRLIGLDDVFDLDYETYLTLLKEAMVKSRMTKKTIPTEEIMLLTDEYKRVKSKKDKGRFEVKKKKITASSFSSGNIKGSLPGSKSVKGLLPAQAIAKSPLTKSLEDNISAITSAVVSISETIRQQKKISDDASSYNRRKAEQEKRGLAENKLEKRFEGLKKVAEKIIAPVKSLLDKILDFIGTVILGRIVYKIVEWMGDPKNASKVKSIIRFVKDWWPALLTSYVLFGTTFGKFVRGTVGLLGRFIFQIGRVAIPQLLKFVKSPVGIGLGLFTAGATIPAMMPGTVNEQERKTSKTSGTTEDKIKALQQQKANLNFFDKLQGKGSEIDEQISYLQTGKTKSYGFSGGGAVNGYVSGEKGVDKVPAMLSDGEFVMSRGAVDKYGVDTLESMNAAAGGTNKPKIVSGIPHAAGGGLIGGDKNYGYRDSNANVPFAKDPVSAINRFLKYKFGVDIGKQATWGPPSAGPSVAMKSSNVPTGSLMNDPVGAVARIANSMGIKTPEVSSSGNKSGSQNILSRVVAATQQKFGGKKGSSKPGEKNMFQEIGEKLQGPGAATYRNAGNIHAKQMLGGMGGPISEGDLASESKIELQKAIQRAKKRTGFEIRKAEQAIEKLKNAKTPKGKADLATQKSFLKKLKAGGIRVQYADYADEKGNMSESAKNAKNILGQFWDKERSKKEGGGYRVEDKYDFDKMKDPMSVLFGRGKTTQQRLQALHQMNPLKGKGDVDMVLGGKRTAAENFGLAGSKTLLGSMLGMSGKPKEPKTTNIGPATMYKPNDPRRKQSGPYQSRFARPKNAGVRPVKPPPKSTPKIVRTSSQGGRRGSGSKPSTSNPPRFSASTKGMRSKQETLGLMR